MKTTIKAVVLTLVLMLTLISKGQAAPELWSNHFTVKGQINLKHFVNLEKLLDLSQKVTGINVPTLVVTVIIYKTDKEIAKEFRATYGGALPEFAYSYYNTAAKTIYISELHYNKYVMAHEITHAVINQFFVVNMPMRSQEILCGYVEHTLRKYGAKLNM